MTDIEGKIWNETYQNHQEHLRGIKNANAVVLAFREFKKNNPAEPIVLDAPRESFDDKKSFNYTLDDIRMDNLEDNTDDGILISKRMALSLDNFSNIIEIVLTHPRTNPISYKITIMHNAKPVQSTHSVVGTPDHAIWDQSVALGIFDQVVNEMKQYLLDKVNNHE